MNEVSSMDEKKWTKIQRLHEIEQKLNKVDILNNPDFKEIKELWEVI